MSQKVVHPTTEDPIALSLAKTYPNRRAFIMDYGPSMGELFQKYPRLLDFDGLKVNEIFNNDN